MMEEPRNGPDALVEIEQTELLVRTVDVIAIETKPKSRSSI